jgi:hypothetical protein
MPLARAVRAGISGTGLAENGGKAQGLGDGSAVGLIFEHRWLLLPQSDIGSRAAGLRARRLPGDDSMAEVPTAVKRCIRAPWGRTGGMA